MKYTYDLLAGAASLSVNASVELAGSGNHATYSSTYILTEYLKFALGSTSN